MTDSPELRTIDAKLSIHIASGFEDILAAAEHELLCQRDLVRHLRRRQRRARLRSLEQGTAVAARRTSRWALILFGVVAFILATIRYVTGGPGGIELFGTAGGAWSLAAVIRPRR